MTAKAVEKNGRYILVLKSRDKSKYYKDVLKAGDALAILAFALNEITIKEGQNA